METGRPAGQTLPAGRILLNGVDIRDLTLDTLRAHTGTVPQDAVIFSAPAMDSIRYGRPDASGRRGHGSHQRRPLRMTSSLAPPRAITFWASGGTSFRAASANIAIARAMLKTRRCCCWTSHQRAGRGERAHGAGSAGHRHAAPRAEEPPW